MSSLHGVLVIDKPPGMTSAAVVAQVKHCVGARRAGHAGTLDPLATGVLPICLGEATKLAGYLLAGDKTYEGELELGIETDTLDSEGEVVSARPAEAEQVRQDQLVAAMAAYHGQRQQIPPLYSALRYRGRRLYELARAGSSVERRPRPVTIHRFELLAFLPPRARFRLDCSKGTYVRSVVADLGQTLRCGARLTRLRRLRSGPFSLEHAAQLTEINRETFARKVISPAVALPGIEAVSVPCDKVAAVGNGCRLRWQSLAAGRPEPEGLIRLLTPSGDLLALVRLESGRLRFERVFTYGLTPGRLSSKLPG